MKILHLITGLHPGGAEKSLFKLVTNLNTKHDIMVCSVIKGGKIETDLIKENINTISLNLTGMMDFPSAVFKFRKILKEQKPDILHCWMWHANIIGRFAAINLPIKVISGIREKCLCSWMNIIDKFTQRFVDIYTTNSWAVYDHILMLGIKKEIRVIYNGIDNKFFDIQKVDHPVSNILVVANLRKQKDIPTILKAAHLLKKEGRKLNWLIAGGSTDYENELLSLQLFCKRLNIETNVQFLGFVDEIEKVMAKSDIWVSATLWEGQSNALLEAMAAGMPIITTNIKENEELVTNGTGYLLPIKSPVLIAEKINILLDNKNIRKEFSLKAKERVELFSIKSNVEEYSKLYEKLLKEEN